VSHYQNGFGLSEITLIASCIVGTVKGLAQVHDVVYIVCDRPSAILRFNATTHQRLADIDVKELIEPWDIAACEQTSQLYVADWEVRIWRVSADGADIKRWLPRSPSNTFKPHKLSVTSTRLLVTSQANKQLIQFDARGDELRRVQLPDNMEPWHAIESPTGTFIVSHINKQLKQHEVSEVDTDGEVLRQFVGSRLPSLGWPQHVAVDSRGNIFVADTYSRHILLLDPQLTLRRCIDEHQLKYQEPSRLCCREQSGQLLVGYNGGVALFDVLRR